MLAVSIYGNRQFTKDIDILVEPNVDDAEEYRTELLAVIQAATEVGNYAPGWFNDELKLFISREKRQQLFFDSFEQELGREWFRVPIQQRPVYEVSEDYIEKHGTQGIAELVWDDEKQMYRYLNLEGKWVWYV